MAVKVTTRLDLRNILKDINKNFSQRDVVKTEIADVIAEEILSGKSPVKGKQFKQYTKKYAQLKRGSKNARKPVDMLVTGDMLNNLKVVKSQDNSLNIFFDSVVASGHNEGNPEFNLPRRPLLPTKRGETFKTKIFNKIVRLVDKAVQRATFKQRRR